MHGFALCEGKHKMWPCFLAAFGSGLEPETTCNAAHYPPHTLAGRLHPCQKSQYFPSPVLYKRLHVIHELSSCLIFSFIKLLLTLSKSKFNAQDCQRGCTGAASLL